ncbi:unannotated protein [freshwater metagenome]|uniref:Unannotated protein n=1 Tax=freshwater metagenome TaxID=449393 RepID=A0A6J7PD90_9ZZZZ
MELSNHPGVWVRAQDGTQAVVGVLNSGHPITHGLVHCILERSTPRDCRCDLGTQQAHTKHVEFLACNVYLAHIDEAFHVHQCSRRRSGHTVLACSGFCNESGLAHPLG